MSTFPVPVNEDRRLRSAALSRALDTVCDPRLDALCTLAARIFDCPAALVSIVDSDRVYFAGRSGIEIQSEPRAGSLSAHALVSEGALVVPDTTADPRFRDQALPIGDLPARFLCAMPIALNSGFRAGAICLLDTLPRTAPLDSQLQQLSLLADAVAQILEQDEGAELAYRRDATAQAARAQEEFLGLVGHELRTPLTVIKGLMSMLAQQLEKPDNIDALAGASRAADQLERAIATLTHYSDLRCGDLHLEESVVSLADLFADVDTVMRAYVQAEGKQLSIDLADTLSAVRVDKTRMQLVLESLIQTACVSDGDRITVSAELAPGGDLSIAIGDSGASSPAPPDTDLGLADDGSLASIDQVKLTGLALPVSKRIVELHGGSFSVGAGANGTRRLISLPAWRLTDEALKTDMAASLILFS